MGTHYYPCPICKAPQQVRAQAGLIVEVEACEACKQDYATREYPAPQEEHQGSRKART